MFQVRSGTRWKNVLHCTGRPLPIVYFTYRALRKRDSKGYHFICRVT